MDAFSIRDAVSRLFTCASLLFALSGTAAACTCPMYDAASLRVEFPRIAEVEIVAFGSEFPDPAPPLREMGRHRRVKIKIVEPFAGEWLSEEWIVESGFEFDCSLNRAIGARFLLAMKRPDEVVGYCNTDSRLPVDREALRRGK